MPWPRRIRITRGQGSLNRFALIIWAEDLSFSGLSPESLCTLFQDRNASTNSRCRLTPVKETKVCPVCDRSEEHTSELQSRSDLVCRLLLEKKNKTKKQQ